MNHEPIRVRGNPNVTSSVSSIMNPNSHQRGRGVNRKHLYSSVRALSNCFIQECIVLSSQFIHLPTPFRLPVQSDPPLLRHGTKAIYLLPVSHQRLASFIPTLSYFLSPITLHFLIPHSSFLIPHSSRDPYSALPFADHLTLHLPGRPNMRIMHLGRKFQTRKRLFQMCFKW